LEAMLGSYIRYGDLSGIIVNVRTGVIVGGHQRTQLFKNSQNKIVKQAYRDSTGSIATGHVDIQLPNKKGIVRIPYREVDWDPYKERAANIAANAAGGDFDQVKLGEVLTFLQKRHFPIEEIPIVEWQSKKAISIFEMQNTPISDKPQNNALSPVDTAGASESLEHTCPRCKFTWSGAATWKKTEPKKADKPKPIADKNKPKVLVKKAPPSKKAPIKIAKRK
jgi:hypothetical protein